MGKSVYKNINNITPLKEANDNTSEINYESTVPLKTFDQREYNMYPGSDYSSTISSILRKNGIDYEQADKYSQMIKYIDLLGVGQTNPQPYQSKNNAYMTSKFSPDRMENLLTVRKIKRRVGNIQDESKRMKKVQEIIDNDYDGQVYVGDIHNAIDVDPKEYPLTYDEEDAKRVHNYYKSKLKDAIRKGQYKIPNYDINKGDEKLLDNELEKIYDMFDNTKFNLIGKKRIAGKEISDKSKVYRLLLHIKKQFED